MTIHLPHRRALLSGASYSAEANALFARFTTPPTTARKVLINNLIVGLKTAGVWSKLDALYVLAAGTAQAGRQNWIADQYNLLAINGPTFVADRGYNGDGSSSYLDSQFNPTTAGGLYSLNSAAVSVWDATSRGVSATNQTGATSTGTGSIILGTLAQATARAFAALHNATTFTDIPSDGSDGLWSISRTSSGAFSAYRNGVNVATRVAVSTSMPNVSIFFGGRDTNGTLAVASSDRLAAGVISSGLSDSDQIALYSALQAYMTAIGA